MKKGVLLSDQQSLIDSPMHWLIVLLFLSSNLQIADRLDRMVATIGRKPLKVMVQVNTSGEECKLCLSISWGD